MAALITIGKVYGGTAVNIIPERISIDGTVRAYHQDARDFIQGRIEEIVKGITQAARATYEITYDRIMPPAYNDHQFAAKVRDIFDNSFGAGVATENFISEISL